ncbi:MAG: CDP-diacylglycerol--serine O-phosphatidyltransferase [Desulfobacterales bacterium]|nr:CDP-diacylglycerol--serine O-phosphatidyltransferase [Desulfobacterales bacterium]
MIREFHLADWFTLANAVCGMGALFSIMTYLELHDVRHVYYACSLVLAALIFDFLDGRIARWRKKTSILGQELDSLADIISFGVAPAIIGYGCGMQGLYDRIVLAFFVACGVSRLARYNVTAETLSQGTDKVKYFEGTPIPTSILLVFILCAGGMVRCNKPGPMVRRDHPCRLQTSSTCSHVCSFGFADDQPIPYPQAMRLYNKRANHFG